MKKKLKSVPDPDMSPEYDFSKGVRGKHFRRYARGASFVLLDPDVVRMFPDSTSVNQALRACGEILRAAKR